MRSNVLSFPQRRAVAVVERHEALGTFDILVRWADGRLTREAGDFRHEQDAVAEAAEMAVTNGWVLASGR